MGESGTAEAPIRAFRDAVDAALELDPSGLSDGGLAAAVLGVRREQDRLEALSAELVLAAHRRGVGTVDGYDSTAAWLRARAGMRTGEVHAVIRAGEVGEVLPDTRRAWRDGSITSGAMRLIADARVEGCDLQFQAAEGEFLAAARRRDMWSLSRLTAYFRACAKRDGDRPADRSGLRAAMVGDRVVVDGEFVGLDGEYVVRALDAFTDPPTEGDDRTSAQRRADGLVRMCRVAMEAGVGGTMATLGVAVVIDWQTWLASLERRQTPPTERAVFDLGGRMEGGFVGPVDPVAVGALLCDSSISRVLTGPKSEPVDVGRSSRAFSVAARRAIVIRDQHCRWPGCEKPPGWCEAHHVEHWEHGGPSDVTNGVLLCSRHHHTIHRHPEWDVRWDQTDFRVFDPDGSEICPTMELPVELGTILAA
ncbi:MAG: DUF222 domain-containing protein [Acidimicrobiia bacterium]